VHGYIKCGKVVSNEFKAKFHVESAAVTATAVTVTPKSEFQREFRFEITEAASRSGCPGTNFFDVSGVRIGV